MIECVFTLDYEIYGNGDGSLKDLIYEPAERLREIFQKRGARFVAFVEVAELEIIEAVGTDPAIALVKNQIREFHRGGFELGLHLHPQWYNARYEGERWLLDYGEYNLCTLSHERIVQIIDRSISYFRESLGMLDFTPFSFRAGNWLFQPTRTAANVLAERGIRVDSSVFKGGLQRRHKLDYRRALRNSYHWTFKDDVAIPDSTGTLLELPIYTQMVPFWKMLTDKRIDMQRKASLVSKTPSKRLHRLLDFLRFWYPLKLDYCRLTLDELIRMVDGVVREDKRNPGLFRPIIAIGHTKDLSDYETVEYFLSYLGRMGITISTFRDVYRKCKS